MPSSQDADQTFKEMWEDARRRFLDLTNKDLTRSANRSLDEVTDLINEKLDSNEPQSESNHKRLKNLAFNVLNLLQILGGVAAQGTSSVFGPSSMCFNAVSYLFDIPNKLKRFQNDLLYLFEAVAMSMMQFKVYQRIEKFARIEVELKWSTHKLMITFVDLCALCIDILSGPRSKRLKNSTKIALFGDDSGVSKKLAEFNQLISNQSQISDAVTLEHVLKSEHDFASSTKTVLHKLREASEASRQLLEEKSEEIRLELTETHDDVKMIKTGTEFLVKDLSERSAQKESSDLVEKICRKVGIASDAQEAPIRELEQMRSRCFSTTSAWLGNLEIYQQWMTLKSNAQRLLILSGSTGAGKSHLLSILYGELSKKYRWVTSNSSRVSITCYNFKGSSKPSRESFSKDSRPVIRAIEFIAAQIANQDKVHARNLALYLEGKDQPFAKDLSVDDLCKELLSPPNTEDVSNIAYFVLLEGLEELSANEVTQLIDALLSDKNAEVRIALTSPSKPLEDSLARLSRLSNGISRIEIAEHNQEDIRQYIESEIKTAKLLPEDSSGLSRLTKLIRQKLPQVVKGNFNDAKQIVDSIAQAVQEDQSEDQIEKLMSKDAIKDQEELIEHLVLEHNESLNNQEIEVLNELLIWTIYATEWKSRDEMQAALSMRIKRIPLQSLESRVRGRYSKFLQFRKNSDLGFDDDVINLCLINSDIESYFRKQDTRQRTIDPNAEEDPKISMTITVKNARLSEVKNFIWDLNEQIARDKFDFTTSRITPRDKATIHADPAEGHLLLTRRCFDLLLDETHEVTQILCRYALKNLLLHLFKLRGEVKKGSITLSERQEILANLVGLLQSADYVDQHLNDDFLRELCWLSKNEGIALHEWLHDSAAATKLSRTDLKWLRHVDIQTKFLVLETIAASVARHWLCDRKVSAAAAYHWISHFLLVIGHETALTASTQNQKSKTYTDSVSSAYRDDTKGQDTNPFSQTNLGGNREYRLNAAPDIALGLKVSRCVEWAKKAAMVTVDRSLFYERLGATYESCNLPGLARVNYLKAKTFPEFSFTVPIRLAQIYVDLHNSGVAIQEYESALVSLRKINYLSAGQKATLVDCLKAAAMLQIKLEKVPEAIQKLEEARLLDPHNPELCYRLLEACVNAGLRSQAIALLNEIKQGIASDGDLTILEELIIWISRLGWLLPDTLSLDGLATLLVAGNHDEIFPAILQSFKRLLARADRRNGGVDVFNLRCCYGVVLEQDGQSNAASQYWEKCCQVGIQATGKLMPQTVLVAARFLFNFHIREARSGSISIQDFKFRSLAMRRLIEKAQPYRWIAHRLRYALASFSNQAGRKDMAREILWSSMRYSFHLLSNNNDHQNRRRALSTMSNSLLVTGDKLNFLSAFSLRGPPERTGYKLPFLACDGCNAYFDFSETIWHCCLCDDIAFHDKCLEKLQNGTLRRFVCGPDHEWLQTPSCDFEFRKTGKDHVHMGGELQDGERVGGKIVPVDEWLDSVREDWGIKEHKRQDKTELALQADLFEA